MNFPQYLIDALITNDDPYARDLSARDLSARDSDTLVLLTTDLIKEVLDDLFDVKKSALLRWRDPESVLRSQQLPNRLKQTHSSAIALIEELHYLAVEVNFFPFTHKLLIYQRSCVSLRGLYYRLAPYFKDQSSMMTLLAKITKRLDIVKEQLGVIPAAKGMIFGAIDIDQDCCCDIREVYIDQYIADSAELTPKCNKVLIVEKHCKYEVFCPILSAVFDNLVRGSLMNFDEMILITGRGFPDSATLRVLRRLNTLERRINFYYLGDYDPHGLQICLTYRKVLPDLTWSGITHAQIAGFGISEGLMTLTDKDARLLTNIIMRVVDEQEVTAAEAERASLAVIAQESERMIELGFKCEIEAFDNQALARIISFL